MHEVTPYHRWLLEYDPAEDENSPVFGKEYNYDLYQDTVYGYYIDPAWDYLGSETLYHKILYCDYEQQFMILEFIGEWNDAINNDIMHLKRNIIDHFILLGIRNFILLGEHVYNFHGSDDSYYEEWFEELDDGWIAAINFRDFVEEEWSNYNIDSFVNFGGNLQITNWRTMKPQRFFAVVDELIQRRIALI